MCFSITSKEEEKEGITGDVEPIEDLSILQDEMERDFIRWFDSPPGQSTVRIFKHLYPHTKHYLLVPDETTRKKSLLVHPIIIGVRSFINQPDTESEIQMIIRLFNVLYRCNYVTSKDFVNIIENELDPILYSTPVNE
jgi:hypothetical protein